MTNSTLITAPICPGERIAGVVVQRIFARRHAWNPMIEVRCGCGAAFNVGLQWGRKLERDVDASGNLKRPLLCPVCVNKVRAEGQKKNASNQHIKMRKGKADKKNELSDAEQVAADAMVRERVKMMLEYGIAPTKTDLFRIAEEAKELVLLERRTGEPQLPRWTPENRSEGLQMLNYHQYASPAGVA